MTEVWAVVEREPCEPSWTRSLHATKAGAWRAAYERRYEIESDVRSDELRGYTHARAWMPIVSIERLEVLP